MEGERRVAATSLEVVNLRHVEKILLETSVHAAVSHRLSLQIGGWGRIGTWECWGVGWGVLTWNGTAAFVLWVIDHPTSPCMAVRNVPSVCRCADGFWFYLHPLLYLNIFTQTSPAFIEPLCDEPKYTAAEELGGKLLLTIVPTKNGKSKVSVFNNSGYKGIINKVASPFWVCLFFSPNTSIKPQKVKK